MIAAFCLFFRKAIGFYITLLSLAWVVSEYVAWFVRDSGWDCEAEGMSQALGICGASGWNSAVLLLTLILLTWQVKTLRSILSRTSDGCA